MLSWTVCGRVGALSRRELSSSVLSQRPSLSPSPLIPLYLAFAFGCLLISLRSSSRGGAEGGASSRTHCARAGKIWRESGKLWQDLARDERVDRCHGRIRTFWKILSESQDALCRRLARPGQILSDLGEKQSPERSPNLARFCQIWPTRAKLGQRHTVGSLGSSPSVSLQHASPSACRRLSKSVSAATVSLLNPMLVSTVGFAMLFFH